VFSETMAEDSAELLVLPSFAGSGTPHMNPAMRAAVVGLTFNTDRPTIFRALLEGETFEMKHNLETLALCGIGVDALRTTGGGSRSDRWMQIRADAFGIPVIRLNFRETGAAGCVMMGGAATGEYKSLSEAAGALVREIRVFTPDITKRPYYDEKFGKFKRMYENIRRILEENK
jgi:xylulokinase